MKKEVKIVICNIIFAFVIIILYSPGLIGLSPFDSSVMKSALSIAIGIVAILLFVMMNKVLLSDKEFSLLENDSNDSDEKTIEILENYKNAKVLGGIAKSTLSQFNRLKNVESNYEKLISQRFEKQSLSYNKFIGVIQNASIVLKRGYVKIANKMIIFDEREYLYLKEDDYMYDDIPDNIQREKFQVYNQNLQTMKAILEKNEVVLLGINKLMTEISDTDMSDNSMNDTAEEIKTLLKQVEYYKKQ